MKKILLLLALCVGTGNLMAQNTKTPEPFDYTLGGKLFQPFKVDSSWRNNPPSTSPGNLFKQEPIDLNKIRFDNNDNSQKQLLIASEGYNMPVAKLDGYSKMPVVVLEGNSKMPIVGKDMTKAKRTTLVNP